MKLKPNNRGQLKISGKISLIEVPENNWVYNRCFILADKKDHKNGQLIRYRSHSNKNGKLTIQAFKLFVDDKFLRSLDIESMKLWYPCIISGFNPLTHTKERVVIPCIEWVRYWPLNNLNFCIRSELYKDSKYVVSVDSKGSLIFSPAEHMVYDKITDNPEWDIHASLPMEPT